MTLNSLLLISFLAVLVIGYLVLPLLQPSVERSVPKDHLRSGLLAERDQVLDTLLELDMDYEMGKVSEEKYQSIRSSLVVKGAEFFKKIEALESTGDKNIGLDKKMDKKLETMIADRKKKVKETNLASSYCTNCGEVVLKSDRFCSNCGQPLKK